MKRRVQDFFPAWREPAENAIYKRHERLVVVSETTKDQRLRLLKGKIMIGRILKLVVILAVLGFAGLAVYAYLADLAPQQGVVTKPVVLDGN